MLVAILLVLFGIPLMAVMPRFVRWAIVVLSIGTGPIAVLVFIVALLGELAANSLEQ